jgi:hypothetical protein
MIENHAMNAISIEVERMNDLMSLFCYNVYLLMTLASKIGFTSQVGQEDIQKQYKYLGINEMAHSVVFVPEGQLSPSHCRMWARKKVGRIDRILLVEESTDDSMGRITLDELKVPLVVVRYRPSDLRRVASLFFVQLFTRD